MTALYLAAATLTSGISGFLFKPLSDRTGSRVDAAVLPVAWYVVLAAVFGVAALCTGGWLVTPALLWSAALGGVAAFGCAFCIIENMKQNSYASAIILVNCSFVFPILLSLLFLGESAQPLPLAGMLITVATAVILGTKSGTGGKPRLYPMLVAVGASLGNGLLDFAIKVQQHYMPGEGEYSFFFFTYLFAAALCLLTAGIGCLTGHRPAVRPSGKTALLALGLAACNGVCFFSISRTAQMNPVVQFVLITSLSILLSLVIGRLFLKEKLGWREYCSLGCCALAIFCQVWNL